MPTVRLRVWDATGTAWRGRGGPAVIDPGSPGGGDGEYTPPAAQVAGAAALGTTSYAIPSTGPVYYVNPVSGNDDNSGTLVSPKRTAKSTIMQRRGEGSESQPVTIVLRGGIYEEGDIQPGNGYHIRVQAFPGETVWFDGSEIISGGWTNNGNGTWSRAYTPQPIPALGVDILQGYAQAHYPDAFFVDGAELWQLADGATPNAEQFSVNRGANTVTIGVNPSGKEIRSTTQNRLFFSGSRIDLLGVGVRRYSGAQTTLNVALFYAGTSTNTVIENCIFTQLGRSGVELARGNCRVSRCTFVDCGQSGIMANEAHDLVLENNVFRRLNRGRWQSQPQTGAVKMTRSRGTRVRYNIVEDISGGNGIWWDVYCTDVQIYGNYIDGASPTTSTYINSGINYEESSGGYYGGVWGESHIIGNTVKNCRKAISCRASGEVCISNNDVHARWEDSVNAQAILVVQDRDAHPPEIASYCPRWCQNVTIQNNLVRPMVDGWQLLVYDDQKGMPRTNAESYGYGSSSTAQVIGGNMLTRVESNWFAPATGTASAGTIMASIGKLSGSRTNLNTPAALRTNDAEIGLTTSKILTNYQSASAPSTPAHHENGVGLTTKQAELLGVSSGLRWIGNPLPKPVES